MDLVKDILVNDLGELQFKAGDLEIGESDYQHVNHILRSKPGYYRKHPLLGVNVNRMVKGKVNGEVRKDIRKQLEGDGYVVGSIIKDGVDMEIDTKRVR